MTRLSEIIEYNEIFVENKLFEEFMTTRYPDKRMVILSCMDTRLVELLPKAMNLKNGDAKIIHNAGAILTQPFGNIMRSIIVAVYELQAEEVFVVGHYDCGMTGINPGRITDQMIKNGIDPDVINTLTHSGINLNNWLKGFDSVREGVETSVSIINNHPLLPRGLPVHGLIIDPVTGKLEIVIDGYADAS
ncbi:MAG: carbonic anhydrase [Paenibacillaceae bacterium]